MTKTDIGKILIVEDEVVIALRLRQRLAAMGFNIADMAYSGEEAVEKATSLRPDLILMDIMIPGKLDGIAAAKIIKGKLEIPVVFLTAFSEDNILERAKHAEPYGYILKPFQDREVKAIVEIALYRSKMEKSLRDSEENFKALAENANDGILIAKGEGEHVFANNRAAKITGYSVSELLKSTIKDLAHPDDLNKVKERFRNIISGKPFQRQYETTLIRKDGKKIPIEVTSAKSKWQGQPADVVVFRDLTERVKAEEALRKAHQELENRVKERTGELEKKTNSLEEINTAMRVLLAKREEDKLDVENNVLTNVKGLIEPFIRKMKQTKLDDRQRAFLNIIKSNLQEIVSPLARELSVKYFHLTPQEIRIANLIKHGDSTKKIADILNLSPRTVETHRKNIRNKMGLEGKKANLRLHLLTLDKLRI